MKHMNIKEFANLLDNREYKYPQLTKEELQIAKDNGFVIVYGASDDLMEFEGVIYDEAGCFNGGTVYFDKNGVNSEIHGNGATLNNRSDSCIEAVWRDKTRVDENGNVITWTYKTDIPHETFMIYDDGVSFCEAIVFNINDVGKAVKLTEAEALKILTTTSYNENPKRYFEALAVALASLEEVQKYRKFGTIEELEAKSETLQCYKNQMNIFAKEYNAVLASDVVDILEELE